MNPDRTRAYVVKAGVSTELEAGTLWRSLTVTNASNLTVSIPGIHDYVPPGATRSFSLVGTQVSRIEWAPPPGTVDPPAGAATGQATVRLSTSDVPPSTGTPATTPPYGQALLNAGGTATSAGVTTTIGPVTLPSGTQSVLVAWRQLSGTAQPTSVSVTDSSQTLVWGSVTIGAKVGVLSDDLLLVPVSTTVDGVLYVLVTEPAATTHTIFIVASPQALSTATQLTGSDAVLPITIADYNNAGQWNEVGDQSVGGTVVSVLAANLNRRGLIVQNTGNTNLRFAFDGGIGPFKGTRLLPNQTAIIDEPFVPTNAMYALSESGTGVIAIVERTA